jgi:O-antigen/teichoic acid export membrane protein
MNVAQASTRDKGDLTARDEEVLDTEVMSTRQLPPSAPDAQYMRARSRGLAGGRAILFRYLVVGVLSLAGSTYLIRVLGPVSWASFSVAYYLIVFLDQTFAPKLLGRLIQADEPPGRPQLEAAARITQAVGLASAAFFAAISYPAADLYGHSSLVPCLLAVGVCAYVYSIRSVSSALLERELRYRQIVAADVVDQFTFYSIAVPAVALGQGIWGVAVALALRGLVPAYLLRRWAPTPFLGRAIAPVRRSILAFGIPAATASLIYLADGLVPLFVLGGAHATELAFTMTAGTIIGYAGIVQVAAQRVGFPSLALLQRYPERFMVALRRTLRLADFAIVSAVVPAAASSPVWLPALLGGEWRRASPVMMAIGAGLIINTFYSVVSPALASLGHAGWVLRLQGAMTASYLILALVITPVSALLGPAIAWAVSRAVGGAVSMVALHRHQLPVPWARQAATVSGSVLAMVLIGMLFYERSWIEGLVVGSGFAVAWLIVSKRDIRVALTSWGRRARAA